MCVEVAGFPKKKKMSAPPWENNCSLSTKTNHQVRDFVLGQRGTSLSPTLTYLREHEV